MGQWVATVAVAAHASPRVWLAGWHLYGPQRGATALAPLALLLEVGTEAHSPPLHHSDPFCFPGKGSGRYCGVVCCVEPAASGVLLPLLPQVRGELWEHTGGGTDTMHFIPTHLHVPPTAFLPWGYAYSRLTTLVLD